MHVFLQDHHPQNFSSNIIKKRLIISYNNCHHQSIKASIIDVNDDVYQLLCGLMKLLNHPKVDLWDCEKSNFHTKSK